LGKLGPEYTRDPEKKTVLLSTLGDLKDERIAPALTPFLEDPSDEVRIAAALALAKQKDERSREAVLKAFVDSSDRPRVKSVLAETLLQTGFGVQGFREKVEAGLPEGYYVDKAGVVKKRE
jgi:HEAT repeat protein